MNNVYLHLILSHVPVIGIVFGIILLITAYVIKNRELKSVAIACFIIIAVAALFAYFTGEAAEESVEHLAWASEPLIERHEEWAYASLIFIGILGIAALTWLLLYMKSKKVPAWFFWSFLILAIVNAGLISRTANLGGQIRHVEIRTASYSLGHHNNKEFNTERRVSMDKIRRPDKHYEDDD